MNKNQLKKNLREIKEEIELYDPPKKIALAMLALGKEGFEFSGHGYGIGGEDFGLIYYTSKGKESYIYVTLKMPVRYCSVDVVNNIDEDSDPVYARSIPNTIKLAKKLKKQYTRTA